MKLQAGLSLIAVVMLTLSVALDVGEKTLFIERYPDEPMQLVDVRVSGQSVKDRVTENARYANKWGNDVIKFTEGDDWFKRVSLTFRNVSDKPIRGVRSILLFEQVGGKNKFQVGLTSSRNLYQTALQPGEEVELTVSDNEMERMLPIIKGNGVEANDCKISFSLDAAIYSDTLQWYRGNLLHPDPEVPNKWIPVKRTAQ